MTSARDNETLARVGPGMPMGELMRQYWMPAALSSELVADGDPVRLMLLGEKLIAFRDSAGKVGILDHRCPHRCASLFFGRNEEGGIRCVYHGWKFDAAGNCLDMANVPPHQDFKHRVHAKAYKTAERNGAVWVYMGDQENPPALPRIEATLVAEADNNIDVFQRERNWLQALEGDIDTSHVNFLHGGSRTMETYDADNPLRYGVKHPDPEYQLQETDWGAMYGAYRPAEEGRTYWRIAHFMMPFWSITPSAPFGLQVYARAWVPIDDTHCMSFRFVWKEGRLRAADKEVEHGWAAIMPTQKIGIMEIPGDRPAHHVTVESNIQCLADTAIAAVAGNHIGGAYGLRTAVRIDDFGTHALRVLPETRQPRAVAEVNRPEPVGEFPQDGVEPHLRTGVAFFPASRPRGPAPRSMAGQYGRARTLGGSS